MVKKTVTWNSSVNFHMRPAGTFSQEMGRFSSSIRLTYGEFRADGKSMMNLMAAGIPARAQLEVECAGPDEAEALARAACLLEEELGE
ncbi:HPr family phosphocarrier protein [Oscillospiraceae bacterium 21-37]|jgi:phosphocarrier protein HPr|uniref:HPr family phosphocarrier protein n=1 Tax=Eubacteriales TaxID=186802 RepID=UPI00136B1550|nr:MULTISPECIES: HPr family phosphocarrier protein [unclassified Neglectibacter]MCI9116083.1 HPr family phosphocarrier protein [Acutalibacter sp.]NBI18211.1 HPr family phosphocarrier protein [Neglectibacter sp. 59]NBJ73888.1 HPr family phosphocarrier protein [Neglectibacter sp. X4]NCE81660.1 HPr family phosphocarrier protein [Neglectibacter sp. X58]